MKNFVLAASTSVMISVGIAAPASASNPGQWAHCDFQVEEMAMPVVIDGARATPEEMAKNQQEVQSYVDSVKTYLDAGCAFNNYGHRLLLGRAELAAQRYNGALGEYRASVGRQAIASVDSGSESSSN